MRIELIIAVLISLSIIILVPIATIASLNLLFSVGIPLTFWTWVATWWLTAIVGGAGLITRNAK